MRFTRARAAKWLSILLLVIFSAYTALIHAFTPAVATPLWPSPGENTLNQDGYFAFQVTLPQTSRKVLVDIDHPNVSSGISGARRDGYAEALNALHPFSDTLPNFTLEPSAFGGQYVTSTILEAPPSGVDSKDAATQTTTANSSSKTTPNVARFSLSSESEASAKVVVTAVDMFGDVVLQETAKVTLHPPTSPKNALADILLLIAFALSLSLFVLYAFTFAESFWARNCIAYKVSLHARIRDLGTVFWRK